MELQLLKVSDAAGILGCSKFLIYKFINKGALPVINIGSSKRPKLRVSSAEIAAFMKRQTLEIKTK